ncbi:MAG: GHKL domain-containing protein [Bacilli bacterium]
MKKMVKFYKEYQSLNTFFLIQISLFILLFIPYFIDNKIWISIVYFAVVLLCFSSYFSLYHIYKQISLHAKLEAEAEMIEKQKKLQEEHLKVSKENQLNMQTMREQIIKKIEPNQDTKQENHRKVINELMEEYASLYNIDYCKNKIVDAILYNKMLLAKRNKIQTKVQVIIPEVLKIKDTDVMSVFTNLIDNAIEASMKLDEKSRLIDIEAMVKSNYLIICVSNHKLSTKINLNFNVTTKMDQANHGLGLNIIKRTCNENNGVLVIEDYDTSVKMLCTLQLGNVHNI